VKYQTAGKLIRVPRRLINSKKADNQNVQRVGVGVVGHCILHHHEENVGTLPDFLCGISHTANRLSTGHRRQTPSGPQVPPTPRG
jgi:hypothetical protein